MQKVAETADTELLHAVHEGAKDKIFSAVQAIHGDFTILENDPRFKRKHREAERKRHEEEEQRRAEELETGRYSICEWQKYRDLGILKDGDLIEIDFSYIGIGIANESITINIAHRNLTPFLKILDVANRKELFEIKSITGMVMFDETNRKKSMYFHPFGSARSRPLRFFFDNRTINRDLTCLLYTSDAADE